MWQRHTHEPTVVWGKRLRKVGSFQLSLDFHFSSSSNIVFSILSMKARHTNYNIILTEHGKTSPGEGPAGLSILGDLPNWPGQDPALILVS